MTWMSGAIGRAATRRPLLFAVAVMVALLLAGVLAQVVAASAAAGPSGQLLAGTGAHVVVAGVLLGAVGRWPTAHVTAPRRWRARRLLLVPGAIVAVPYLSGPLRSPPWGWPVTLVEELGTGFAEEAVCRGVILAALLRAWGGTPSGARRAVLVQALLFGAAHLVTLDPVIVVASTVLGFLFGAVVVRVGAIWPTMLFHAVGNIGWQLVPEGGPATAAAILWTTAMAVGVVWFSWFVLRAAGGPRSPEPGLAVPCARPE